MIPPIASRLRFLFTALILLVCFDGTAYPATRQQSREAMDSTRNLRRMIIPGTDELQLIIELSDPGLLERMTADNSLRKAQVRPSDGNRRMSFNSPQASSYRLQISRSRESLKKRIQQFEGAEVLGTTDALMNSIIVRAPAKHYRAMRRLPGIKKIYFSRPRRMLLDSAAAVQNAQQLWDAAGGLADAGKGIKIGIIDSGINISNPMFSGAGLTVPNGYPLYDSAADQALTNSKVIVARSYVRLLSSSQWTQSAVDEIGHGSFVAGCAAGEHVSAPLASISGMAPGAYLGNYKILGTPGINESTTSAAIIAAIDDAVSDGMDVINLSIGALDYLPPDENAEYIALERAVQAGLVVTVSAGNDGSSTHTISSPATVPEVITVGSVTGSREFLAALHTTNPDQSTIGYLPSGDGIQVQFPIAATKVIDVASLRDDGLGCLPFSSGSLSSSIAFVQRGTCTFAEKVENAENAGAVAVVVFNNVANGKISMSGLDSASIPAVMISNSDGLALKQYIGLHPSEAKIAIDISSNLQAVPTTARVVSSFSSAGPGTDFSIKPDLVAVGENVYSATGSIPYSGNMYDASGFTVSQGTSFSAPMVAGAAAALIQRFPSLGAAAIKSLLTTTATRNVTQDGVNAADVLAGGAGLLHMGNAWNATAVFAPTNLSFGAQSYTGTLSLTKTLTIENISSNSDRFTIEIEPIVSGPSILLSGTDTGIVAPGASTAVDVTLQATSPQTGGFQGFINIRSTTTSFVYRIPYWAGLYVPDSIRVLRISSSASGSGYYSDLAEAIADAQPGNIIEIEDNESYSSGSEGLVISTNRLGLPLHGLTIRAAAGKTPTIKGENGTTALTVIGLRNVLLQGLKIEGGYTGVELYQPSASVPLAATIDNCTITGASGDTGATGVWIDGGGTVEITKSVLENSSGSGLVAGSYESGTQLMLIGSNIRQNAMDGIDAYDSDVYISGSAFSENSGAGLYLESCTGTVDGNTMAGNKTTEGYYYGDGLQIANGNITARNNLIHSNTEAGIALFLASGGSGPVVRLIGNTIRDNGSYGIFSSPSPSLVAEGNLIKNNGGGSFLDARSNALYLNNIVHYSTDSLIGHGFEIDTGSNVRIINNTIYQNRLYGVKLAGGTVSITNSIIYGNAVGAMSGVPSSSIQSSLTINPRFVAPASDDFSLAAGSPAIDAGSNSVLELPFLDYYGRLRVGSASDIPGTGNVDVGAVESNSAYPLVYPLIANGSDATLGSTFVTGIAFANPDSTDMQLKFTAYDAAGSRLSLADNPSEVSLNAEQQAAILGYQLFGFESSASMLGSVLGSSGNKAAGFFLLMDSGFRQFATGANAMTRLGNDLVFMRHQNTADRTARYIIFNPGVATANVTVTLHGAGGERIGDSQSAAIAPKGRAIVQFDSAASSGYIRIASDRPVSGIELVGNEKVIAALGGSYPGSQGRLFFPHFAVGSHYSTEISIINTSSSAAVVTLTAYNGDGSLIGSIGSISLSGGGQLMTTMTELFGIPVEGSLQTGYLIAQSDQPGIMGYTDFTYNDGVRVSDASIPADSVPNRRLIFSHVAHGVNAGNGIPYQTGIALLNPFGTSVDFTIRVYNGAGALIAEDEQTIGPRQRLSKILAYPAEGVAFFTQDLVLGNGHIEITSDYGLIGLELFYTEDLSQMASVPAQVMD